MELQEFIINLFPERPEDIVVHYEGKRCVIAGDSEAADVLEQLTIDAEMSRELDIILEVPKKNRYYRRRISLQEVSPLALPQEERPDMPSVTVRFNPVTLAPEHLILQDQFALPVVRWESFASKTRDQWPPMDSSYGIPFGSYQFEVGLPELPDLRKRTAEVLLTLSPDLNMGLSTIKTGLFSWDYSHFSWSVEDIDPEGFKVFQLVKERVKDQQTKKIEALFEKEWQEF